MQTLLAGAATHSKPMVKVQLKAADTAVSYNPIINFQEDFIVRSSFVLIHVSAKIRIELIETTWQADL